MNRIIGGRPDITWGLIASLLSEPEKESPEVKAWRQAKSEERRRHNLVLQNICPGVECDGTLVRGKKNKKNDYKRDWKCEKCSSVYSY